MGIIPIHPPENNSSHHPLEYTAKPTFPGLGKHPPPRAKKMERFVTPEKTSGYIGDTYIEPLYGADFGGAEEADAFEKVFRTRGKDHTFIIVPDILHEFLTIEEAFFLSFLVNWRTFKAVPEILVSTGGWFYCPTKAIRNRFHKITKNGVTRLFNALEKVGVIERKMKYGVRKEDGETVPANHRMIFIHFSRILGDGGEE